MPPPRHAPGLLFWRVFFTRTGAHPRITSEGMLRSKTLWASGILHHAIIDLAEAQGHDIKHIILIEPPRPLRALFGHLGDRALHIAGGEIQPRRFRDRGIGIVRHALFVAVL